MVGVSTMVVLGSGGHTAEMLTLLSAVDRRRFAPRTYVVADGDTLSWQKAEAAEQQLLQKPAAGDKRLQPPLNAAGEGEKAEGKHADSWQVVHVPRSRHVGQSWWSSVLSTLLATVCCLRLLMARRPQLLLVNVAAMVGVSTMVVLGSGGHTAEMLTLLSAVDRRRFAPRTYVVADGDTLSWQKAEAAEQQLLQKPAAGDKRLQPPLNAAGEGEKAEGKHADSWQVVHVPRSRHVGQSWWSSVLSTLLATVCCLRLLMARRPQLLLVNGPGTCVPLCVCTVLLRPLLCWRVRVVFVESVCRVNTLSLSGRILYRLVDRLIVQWPDLLINYPNAIYMDRLV